MEAQGVELAKRPVDGRNCGNSSADNVGRAFCGTTYVVGGEAH